MTTASPVPEFVRLRLLLGYDGGDFSGWATQPGRRTVQETLEHALATVLRLPAARLVVAGRTDAGVHATGQVAHLDVPIDLWDGRDDRLLRSLRGLLPADVRVFALERVPPDFDARFAASWRRYEYRVGDAPGGVDPLRRRDVLDWPRALDAGAMAMAAQELLGLHDFAAFCRAAEGRTTIRTLQRCDVERDAGDPHRLTVTVVADAFCHSMVRALVGALLAVGEHRREPQWPASLLRLDRRSDDVAVAPAHGLTLAEVGYPPPAEYAARVTRTRARRA